jgi:hypothetical protein
MTIRLASAVDVVITGAKFGTSRETIVEAIQAHTRLSVTRATEVAELILRNQRVGIELPSKQAADLMLQDLQRAGLVARAER